METSMSQEDDATIHRLYITATRLKRKLTDLVKELEEIRDTGRRVREDASVAIMFRGMGEALAATYQSFCSTWDQLTELDLEHASSLITEEDQTLKNRARKLYYESLGYVKDHGDRLAATAPRTMTSLDASLFAGSVRRSLPSIPIPLFDGQRSHWKQFYDSFTSLIHQDASLNDIDKFHYLLGALTGPAAALIKKLPATSENYAIAWNTLIENYDDQRLLASAYLDQLLEIQPFKHRPPNETMRVLIADISDAVAAFKALEVPDHMDFTLFHIVRKCLDPQTVEAFEAANSDDTFPTFKQLMNFLRKRCNIYEKVSGVKFENLTPKLQMVPRRQPMKMPDRRKSFGTLATSLVPEDSTRSPKPPSIAPKRTEAQGERSTPTPCYICQENHPLFHCKKFTELTIDQRHAALTDWAGCKNCLSAGHNSRKCQSRWRCRHCKGKHHSLLHRPNETPPSVTAACTGSQTPMNPCTIGGLTCILGTAMVQVNHHNGGQRLFRAVLDSASHASFITREAAYASRLTVTRSNLRIHGIGETPLPGFRGLTRCILSAPVSPDRQYNLQLIAVDSIMAPQPTVELPHSICNAYRNFELADPEFWVTKSIDLLLGCDILADILTGEIIDVPKSTARLIGTTFGFVVLGRVPDMLDHAQPVTSMVTSLAEPLDQLQKDLQRFWAIDDPPSAKVMSAEERLCEEHFQRTVSRLPTGRYVVKLPFHTKPAKSKVSTGACLRRLYNLEAKLERSPHHRQLYNEFMREYKDLGHMEEASTPSPYLIPHQGVFKGSPPTDKVRVVFDASAKPGCLNDYLHTGPKLQNDLANILLNLRRHRFIFTADISKMYRQILVDRSERQYQHILWRFDPSEPVQEFELRTLTYGMACAPYLALRVIKQLVLDEGDAYPLAARAVSSDMYIDDFVSGADTRERAAELKSQVVQLMLRGEFPLGKWTSNEPALLEDSERQNVPPGTSMSLDLEGEHFIKILGLQWSPIHDVFSYKIEIGLPVSTKRGLLANIAKIYDPLGFLSPVVVSAKIILQDTWRCQVDWDSPLPESLAHRVQEFFLSLPELRDLRIPRHVCSGQSTHILIFADASERAYCACAYLRSETGSDVSSILLQSKTKLAPIKTITIPRLELCACLLAATLLKGLRDFIFKLATTPKVLMFTDSQVALSWIKRPHLNLPTFVANRVARILEETEAVMWSHVKSAENPSDLGSRGATPRQLMEDPQWIPGPKWITNPPERWDLRTDDIHMEAASQEQDSSVISTHATTLPQRDSPEDWMHRFSSFSTLTRVTAWMLRFTINTKSPPQSRRKSCPTVEELRKAIEACCRSTQMYFFPVCATEKVPKRLISLAPFTDEHGVIRVGGRLKHAPLPSTARHPILLPAQSHLAQLIVSHYHKISLHPGPSLLAALVRSKYWITGLRNMARKICRECVKCRRADAKPCQPPMGDIPRHRFQEGRAFLNVGFDFGGPFLVRDSLKRKASTSKAYLCLAICLSTRAVHLEAVSSLSTPAYIAALERFINRRGLPSAIFSDNGTNFVGARNLLSDWYRWQNQSEVKETMLRYTAEKEIEWHFLPPHAPHFGGLWEAGIKSAKRLLRSTYGEASLTFEEFHTLLAKVEGMLNSRPLCPLSDDPHEDYLTPAHFLIGSSLQVPPEPSLLEQKPNYAQRWQIVTRISQHFWNRWRQEYLGILQIKAKWIRPALDLKVGDLVFIQDDRVPRLQWPRGRVAAVHPGPDNRVRVVTVRTATSTFQRPVVKLVPLFCPTTN